MTDTKQIIIVSGMIIAIVGIFINNWKLSVVGNTIALGGMLFA